ncbi:hypothetical protein [Microbulbifer sp. TYP-18]|uniref:hypothetical protein n=1 Tax=Microbulbifer sp. TYP-18 TaxID=3230024 RepID=UPI0034C67A7E
MANLKEQLSSSVKNFAYVVKSGDTSVTDMAALVDATSQLPLSKFNYWERLIRSEYEMVLERSTRKRLRFWLKRRELLTWLDLISWDGYRRERALRAISEGAPNAFFFSMALRRLNDWVPQVRKAAIEKLPIIAKKTKPSHVVEALCVAFSNWNSWGRIEEAGKRALLRIASVEEVSEPFKEKLIFSTSGPMPSVFAQLGRTTTLDSNLFEIAERAIQPSVRAKAYRSLFEGRMVWIEGWKWEWKDIYRSEWKRKLILSERILDIPVSLMNLLEKSSEDRSSFVRRISAEFLIRNLENLGDNAYYFAQKFSLDSASPVSERGRFALKKLRESNCHNLS